jgi:hypothetical protein
MILREKKWWKIYWFELFLFITSAAFRFYAYHKSPYANGWDGYFYIIQIKALIEDSQMHTSRYSLFYPVLLFFQWIITDYELTYKIVSAMIVGSFSLVFYKLSKSLNTQSNISYVLGTYTLFSPHLTYFGSQYPKNLLGLTLFLMLVISLFNSKYGWTGLLLVINLFVHKMTAGLSIITVLLVIIFKKLTNRSVKKILLAGLAVIVILLIYFQIIGLNELKSRGFLFTTNFQWPTLSFINSFKQLLSNYWIIELIVANVVFIGMSIYLIYNKRTDIRWFTLMGLLILLTFPFLEWSILGVSFRFFMVFILLSPILLSQLTINLNFRWLLLIGTAFFISGILVIDHYPTNKYDPPYGLYRHIAKRIADKQISGDIDVQLLIAHKSLAEYITFKTKIDVLPWIPEYKIDSSKLWRIATGLNAKTISYYLNDYSNPSGYEFLTVNYILIREDQWQKLLGNIKSEDPALFDELTNWKNPFEIRPGWLSNK